MDIKLEKYLDQKLTQLCRQQLGQQIDYYVISLDEGTLVRIRTPEGLSQLFLAADKIGVRDGHTLVLVKGQLIKPEGEFIKFSNLLALPKSLNLEQQVEVDEEAVIEVRGVVVTPSGEILEFRDQNQKLPEIARADKSARTGCESCRERVNPRALQVERRVGPKRCWLCTSLASAIGVGVSALFAWLSRPIVQSLSLEALQMVILLAGSLFTGWRVWYWGYLPFQDWIAYTLRLDRAG